MKTNYGDTTGCALFFVVGASSIIVGLIYAVVHFA
jgi:hypothetical protein